MPPHPGVLRKMRVVSPLLYAVYGIIGRESSRHQWDTGLTIMTIIDKRADKSRPRRDIKAALMRISLSPLRGRSGLLPSLYFYGKRVSHLRPDKMGQQQKAKRK